MKYTTIRLGAALLACSFIFACSSPADAGWGLLRGGGSSGGSVGSVYGGSGGYTASYGSSGYAAYSSVGGSYGGSRGGPGILRRVAGRIHGHLAAKRARHIARRTSYGSSGMYAGGSRGASYSSYGGGSTGYRSYGSTGYARRASYGSVGTTSSYGSVGTASSYGSVGSGTSYGSVGSTGYGSVGGGYYGASNASTSSASSLVSNVSGDAVYLTVAVPSDAKVFVNGNETKSSGAVRQFVSRGLKPGKSYKFEVRAELESADGEPLVDSKSLVVSAGQREQVQFAFDKQDSPIQTAITLNVPEGATVLLSGNETNATGTVRTFRTSQLKPSEVWDDYKIQVKLGDDIKTKSIRLIGGDNLELTFAFDDKIEKLVSR